MFNEWWICKSQIWAKTSSAVWKIVKETAAMRIRSSACVIWGILWWFMLMLCEQGNSVFTEQSVIQWVLCTNICMLFFRSSWKCTVVWFCFVVLSVLNDGFISFAFLIPCFKLTKECVSLTAVCTCNWLHTLQCVPVIDYIHCSVYL